MPEKHEKLDKELEQFRGLMEPPSTFEDGFNWTSFLGTLFVSLIMVPGAMYMGLLAGEGIGPAAQWVTVILFIEIARRAQRHLKRAEIFVLFFMAGAVMSAPFSGLIWNQFFVRSDAAVAHGIAEWLPNWFAPPAESQSYAERSFFRVEWLPAIGLVIFTTFFGQLSNLVLGYGLFRLTSDIEKLPFPMAPVSAQGILALAEGEEQSWRWRVFAIGGATGLVFGAVYVGLPTLTGALTGRPIMIFPIPFYDATPKTESVLPAVATGFSWDLGNLIFGMVLPFFAVLGSFIGLVISICLNPILHKYGILDLWTPGDTLQTTMFKNNVDFYFSFGIGVSLAVAIVGFYQIYRSLRGRAKDAARGRAHEPSAPAGRGDIPPWAIGAVYVAVTLAYILVSGFLIDWHPGVMVVLFVLGFVFTPVISYVTARLEGMAGQAVEIPMVREASLILSGYRGVNVWFLPIPLANYGRMTVFYRECELTGTRFSSVWKASVVLYPVVLVSSIMFANFIWGLAEVPSAMYPYAQRMWELEANNRCIMYSSTLGGYSMFEDAFSWGCLAVGTCCGVVLFSAMSWLGAPIFLTYGLVRGLGQGYAPGMIPQMIGALLGRFYFLKKIGPNWRRYVPVLAAGYACGQGLVAVFGIGITFISKAVVQMPF